MWVLVMEIDELNFCVAEPQELRQSPNVEKCMGMEVIGILVIGCCPKLNMSILLPEFQLLLITSSSWLTFWLMKRFLGPVMAILLQE